MDDLKQMPSLALPSSRILSSVDRFLMTDLIDPGRALRSYFDRGLRPDGRGLMDFRPVRFEPSISSVSSSTASSSSSSNSSSFSSSSSHGASPRCVVSIGNTVVSAAATVTTGTPRPGYHDCGRIDFEMAANTMSQPSFDGHKGKSDEAFSLESLLDNIFLSSSNKIVDLKDLCIEEGRLVYVINIKVAVVSDDGNINDAAVFAVMKLLSMVRIPSLGGRNGGEASSLLINQPVAMASFSIIDTKTSHTGSNSSSNSSNSNSSNGLYIICDPVKNEESSSCLVGHIQIAFYRNGEVAYLRQESAQPLNKDSINDVIRSAYASVNSSFFALL